MNRLENHSKSICFVIPKYVTYSTGGAEIQVFYLISEFLKRGWKVEVVCAGKGYQKQILFSPFYKQEITYHYYKTNKIRTLEIFGALKALLKTNSTLYYQRTDFALTAATKIYCTLKRQKMVYALASDSDGERKKYTKMMSGFVYTSKLKKWIRKTDFLLLDKMLEWAKKGADFIICQNARQMALIEENFNRECYLVSNSFIPEDTEKQLQKENVVLWVGNDSLAKRPELFLKLAQRFIDEKKWKFVMIGAGCDVIRHMVIPENLELLGEKSYSITNEWFNRSRVYVNTSEDEGMPNTFIQSWYYSVLVFSLKVDPDLVFKKRRAGLVFDDSIEALSEELKKVIMGINNYSSCLDNGENYFQKTFNIDENCNRLLSIVC